MKQQKKRLNLIFCLFFLPLFLPFLAESLHFRHYFWPLAISFSTLLICQIFALHLRLKWQLKHPLRLTQVSSFIFTLTFGILVALDIAAIFESSAKLTILATLALVFLLNNIIGFIQIQSKHANYAEPFPEYTLDSKTIPFWIISGILLILLLWVNFQALHIITAILPYFLWNFITIGLVIIHWYYKSKLANCHPVYNHAYTAIAFKSGLSLLVISILFKDMHWPYAIYGIIVATVLLIIGFILSTSPMVSTKDDVILDNDL
jgi:hypothetical protein